jgi:hypothetical protein
MCETLFRARPGSLQGESLMISISLFSRMILSKMYATFWDPAFAAMRETPPILA